uniref:Uncharacterized protein n=1 Tax=Setaria italica TaxID=4555 RepID=K3YXG9_SETIT
MYNLNKAIYSSSFHLSKDTICREKRIAVSSSEPCLFYCAHLTCASRMKRVKTYLHYSPTVPIKR